MKTLAITTIGRPTMRLAASSTSRMPMTPTTMSIVVARITSYNVCYTKLLRGPGGNPPRSSSASISAAPSSLDRRSPRKRPQRRRAYSNWPASERGLARIGARSRSGSRSASGPKGGRAASAASAASRLASTGARERSAASSNRNRYGARAGFSLASLRSSSSSRAIAALPRPSSRPRNNFV